MVNIYDKNPIYMSKKFNKFETLCEKAFTHHSNGGFRTNTPVKLRPEFFNSDFYKTRYQTDSLFDTWLRGCIQQNPNLFFFIHDIAANSTNASAKDANDLAGSNYIILTLKMDPRTLQAPTEYNEFSVPGDFNLIEVLDFGINLPPVQGVPNKYENYEAYTQSKPVPANPDDFKALGNQPMDNKLPVAQTSIPASPAIAKKYFTGPTRSKKNGPKKLKK
jgi:hypothetical protein